MHLDVYADDYTFLMHLTKALYIDGIEHHNLLTVYEYCTGDRTLGRTSQDNYFVFIGKIFSFMLRGWYSSNLQIELEGIDMIDDQELLLAIHNKRKSDHA